MSDQTRFRPPDDWAAAERLGRYFDALAVGHDDSAELSVELAELAAIGQAANAAMLDAAPEPSHDNLKALIADFPEWAALASPPATIESPPAPPDGRAFVKMRSVPRIPWADRGEIWPFIEAVALLAAVLTLIYIAFGRDHAADQPPATATVVVASPVPASPTASDLLVGDCPMQGCFPSRSVGTDRRVPATLPAQIWSVALSAGMRGLVASGNNLYATDGGTLVALDLETGANVWRVALGVDPSALGANPPAVIGGFVYLATSDGTVICIDVRSGTEVWRHALAEPVRVAVAVANGLVYVGTAVGSLYALETGTGSLRWVEATGPIKISSPVVLDGTVYVGAGDKTLFAFDAQTGKPHWTKEVAAGMKSIAVNNGIAVVASRNTGAEVGLTAFSATDASQKWRQSVETNFPPAIVGSRIYAIEQTGVSALDANRGGARSWIYNAAPSGVVDSVVSETDVLLLCRDGTVIDIDTATGRERWRLGSGANGVSLAVGAGVIYVVNKDGLISAYGIVIG